MPNLAPQSRTRIIRAITKAYGYALEREGGRHSVFSKPGCLEPLIVPRHKEISPGVQRSLCKTMGIPVAEFLETLRNC